MFTQTDRQTDRQTDTHTYTHNTHTHTTRTHTHSYMSQRQTDRQTHTDTHIILHCDGTHMFQAYKKYSREIIIQNTIRPNIIIDPQRKTAHNIHTYTCLCCGLMGLTYIF